MASLIFSHVVRATEHPCVTELCRLTGLRVGLHHLKDGRIQFRLIGDRHLTPSFGSASELIAHAESVLSGFLKVTQ